MKRLSEHPTLGGATKKRRAGDKGGKRKCPKLKCSVCGAPNVARFYCPQCSDAQDRVVAVCGCDTNPQCWTTHVYRAIK